MAKITSDLLAKLAPGTKPALRDRFLLFLNEACPRYDITSELRVGAFLATICLESDYFKATKEGRATRGKAKTAQDKYWSTGFYGRGLIQTTHRPAYLAFSRAMFTAGKIENAALFVAHPELLELPEWAVESACYYWQSNNLNKYADKGKFFAIQGLVNRGNAGEEAWGYPARLKLYEAALRFMPDDFSLDSAAVSTGQALAEPVDGEPRSDANPTADSAGSQEQPPTIHVEQTKVENSDGDSVTATKTTTSEPVTVTKVAMSLWSKVVAGFTAMAALGLNAGTIIQSKLEDVTLNQVFIIGMSVLLLIITLFYVKKRQEANDLKEHLLIETAANKDKNTVSLVK